MSRYLFICLSPVVFIVAGYLAGISLAAAGQDSHMQANPLIEQSVNDLAQRESVSPSIIKVVGYEELTWPDTSLGCPHPGMRYLQVPQDGARIVLQINDRMYVYHSGGSRPPFLCSRPVRTKSPPPSGINR